LWDEEGLYVYVVVTDPAVTENAATGSHHESDSVELFINEAYPGIKTGTYANIGGQYRVGANGELSGHTDDAVIAFKALNKAHAERTADGYLVIFQAPWRFKDNYPLADQKQIGFEIQINACGANAGRYGVVVWNNTKSQSYNNVTDYAPATLDLDGNVLRVEARAPQITEQPLSATYDEGEAIDELSVTANAPDAGVLSYEWFKATSNTAAGTSLGATGTTYQPTDTAVGDYFYYVEITNTLAGATAGYETKKVTSARAKISIVSFDMDNQVIITEEITLFGAGFPIYEFNMPPGYTWGDFTKITAEFFVDEDNAAKSIRAKRLMGNYLSTDIVFDAANDIYRIDYSKNASHIMHDGVTIDLVADDWVTVEYDISAASKNAGFNSDNLPAAGDTGPFYFGIGLPGGSPGNDGAENKLTYQVRNVMLTNDDGSVYIVSQGSGFDAPVYFVNATVGDLDQLSREEISRTGGGNIYGHQTGTDSNGAYFIVGLNDKTVKNADPFPGNYQGFNVKLDLPESFDIGDYSKWSVVLNLYDMDGDPLEKEWVVVAKFFSAWVSESDNPGDILQTQYNAINQGTDVSIGGTFTSTPGGFRVENSDFTAADATGYIEIVEIKFHN